MMSAVCAAVFPAARRSAALQAISPVPKPEPRESTTRTVRSGNSSSSSWAAIRAAWQVPLMPEDMEKYTASSPRSSTGRKESRNSWVFSRLVCTRPPWRSIS